MGIWGNHSKSQVPDANKCTLNGKPIAECDGMEPEYLFNPTDEDKFMHKVQYRGASVIQARGLSSAMSAANASKDCVRDWHLGTSEPVAMSVWSNGNPYGVPENIFY